MCVLYLMAFILVDQVALVNTEAGLEPLPQVASLLSIAYLWSSASYTLTSVTSTTTQSSIKGSKRH